jgi:uncharacterized protein YidB (DUF937 family)
MHPTPPFSQAMLREETMARGFPSMTALLALLAVAGYQNRDKIAEMLGGAQGGAPGTAPGGRLPSQTGDAGALGGLGGLGSILGGILGAGGAASAGSVLNGGLGELVDRFRQNGRGDMADSWVNTGPNFDPTPNDLEQAIGSDVLDDLAAKTGLSRAELLTRLSKTLPSAVDQYTPDGRLPSTL